MTHLVLTRPREGDFIFFSSGRFLQRRRDNWNWFKFSPRSRNSTELRNWFRRFEPPATIIPLNYKLWFNKKREYFEARKLTNLPATSTTVQPWLLLRVSKDGPRIQDPDVVSRIWTWSRSTSFLREQPLTPDLRWNPPIRKTNLPAETAQFPLPRTELGWLLRRLHCCERAFNIWTWMSRNNEYAFHNDKSQSKSYNMFLLYYILTKTRWLWIDLVFWISGKTLSTFSVDRLVWRE